MKVLPGDISCESFDQMRSIAAGERKVYTKSQSATGKLHMSRQVMSIFFFGVVLARIRAMMYGRSPSSTPIKCPLGRCLARKIRRSPNPHPMFVPGKPFQLVNRQTCSQAFENIVLYGSGLIFLPISWAACIKRIYEIDPLECPNCKSQMRIIAFIQDAHSIKDIMKAQGIPDFQAPPPIPKFIDTVEAVDEIPSYDSFEPAPDDF